MAATPIPPILDQDRYVRYEPVALTTDFDLPFPYFGTDASELLVLIDGVKVFAFIVVSRSAGALASAVLPVEDAVVRLAAGVSGVVVEIYGSIRPRRTVQATAAFGTRDFNFVFSYVVAALREMWSQFTRAIQVPPGEATVILPASADRAGKVLGFASDGSPLALSPMSGGLVDTASILDEAVTTPKIAAQAVGLAQLAPSLYGTGADQLLQLDGNGKVASSALDLATADDLRGGSNDLNAITAKTVADAMASVALVYAPSMTIDHRHGTHRTLTLAGNAAIAAPANILPGMPLNLWIAQDATGGRVITGWGAAFDFGEGSAPALSAVAGAVDLISFVANPTGTKLVYIGTKKRVD